MRTLSAALALLLFGNFSAPSLPDGARRFPALAGRRVFRGSGDVVNIHVFPAGFSKEVTVQPDGTIELPARFHQVQA